MRQATYSSQSCGALASCRRGRQAGRRGEGRASTQLQPTCGRERQQQAHPAAAAALSPLTADAPPSYAAWATAAATRAETARSCRISG